MKQLCIPFLNFCLLLTLCSSIHGEDSDALQEKIGELKRTVSQLEQHLAELQQPPRFTISNTLADIVLSNAPTELEIKQYIAVILAKTRLKGSPMRRYTDPEVKKLKAIGSDNAHILLEFYLHGIEGLSKFYVTEALKVISPRSLLPELRKNIDVEYLIQVVERKGWINECKDEIRALALQKPQRFPRSWLKTLASLKIPETVDYLKECIIKGPRRYDTCEAVKSWPEIDWSDAILTSWTDRELDWSPYDYTGVARFAAELGDRSAVIALAENYLVENNKWNKDQSIQTLFRVLSIRPTEKDADVIDWILQHKEALSYNTGLKTFVINGKEKYHDKKILKTTDGQAVDDF